MVERSFDISLAFALGAVLVCIVPYQAAVPPRVRPAWGVQEQPETLPDLRRSPVNSSASERQCCTGPGYTFDRCAASRACLQPRFCINEYSGNVCSFAHEEPCHCVPIDMVECIHPSQCSYPYETCAFLPEQKPYCYSAEIVSLNGSFTIYTGGECCESTTTPPTTTIPPVSTPTPTQDTTTPPPTYPPPAETPPSATPPSTTPPTAVPPTSPSYSPSTVPTSPPTTTTPPVTSPPPYPSKLTPVPVPSPQGPPVPGAPSPSPTSGGRAGDKCEPARPCLSYRQCINPDTRNPCTSGCTGICMHSIVCKCSADCYDGEVCAGASGQEGRYCFSPDAIERLPWATTYPCTTGMTGDPCKYGDNVCQEGRTCVEGGRSECLSGQALCGVNRPACTASSQYCYCNAIKSCDCENGCIESEVCCDTVYGQMCISRAIAHGNGNMTVVECNENLPPAGTTYAIAEPEPPRADDTSPSPLPGTDDSDNDEPDEGDNNTGSSLAVCIDVRRLTRFHPDDLIYDNHVMSSVLCDRFESCATPGHIIQYKGTAMMMMTYCQVVGCVSKRMHVNSPKYQRRLQVPSNTRGLIFTALAARFVTRGEEFLLSTAIHLGL